MPILGPGEMNEGMSDAQISENYKTDWSMEKIYLMLGAAAGAGLACSNKEPSYANIGTIVASLAPAVIHTVKHAYTGRNPLMWQKGSYIEDTHHKNSYHDDLEELTQQNPDNNYNKTKAVCKAIGRGIGEAFYLGVSKAWVAGPVYMLVNYHLNK